MIVCGEALSADVNYSVLKSGPQDGYFIMADFTPANTAGGNLDRFFENIAEEVDNLKRNPIVAGVGAIYGVNGYFINDDSAISITIYTKALCDAFPAMRRLGLDFGKDGKGAIMGAGDNLKDYKIGDSLLLTLGRAGARKVSYTASARLPLGGKIMSFNRAGSKLTSDYLFRDTHGGIIIMDDDAMSRLASLGGVHSIDMSYFLFFREDAPQSERDAVISELSLRAKCYSVPDLIELARNQRNAYLRERLPAPLFMLAVSTTAFFSAVALLFKRDEHNSAVAYLCGCSVRRCGLISLCTAVLLTLIPVLLNVGIVFAIPPLQARQPLLWITFFYDYRILLVIFGYFVLTVATAVLITAGSMARYTPQSYLRRSER